MTALLNRPLMVGEIDQLKPMPTMLSDKNDIFEDMFSDSFHWKNRPITRSKEDRNTTNNPLVHRRQANAKSPNAIYSNETPAPLRVESPELRRRGMVLDDVRFSMPFKPNGNYKSHHGHTQHERGMRSKDRKIPECDIFSNNVLQDRNWKKMNPKSKQRNGGDDQSQVYSNAQFHERKNSTIFPEVEDDYKQQRNGFDKTEGIVSPPLSRKLRSGALHIPKRPPVDSNYLFSNGHSSSSPKTDKQSTPEPMSPVSPMSNKRRSFLSSAHIPPSAQSIPLEVRRAKSPKSKTFLSTADIPRNSTKTTTEPSSPNPKGSNLPRRTKNSSAENSQSTTSDSGSDTAKDVHPILVSIGKIQADADNLGKQVVGLSGSKSDKEYLRLEEMLMRNLLELDKIETNGKIDIRTARKKAVHTVQKYLELLESVK
ncbi:uncharacterized protein [Antedon mediterranea]|uniref:uncharacterized protein isoform X2 n=1 Tax=Antedon mediterranea TaxID=105859 RepID=UPI003AF889B2